MRTLNDLAIMDEVPRPLRSLSPVRAAYAALIFGCFLLPAASVLPAGDLLVKEYIYLDGNLLAVEHQFLPLPAVPFAAAAGTVVGGKPAPFPGTAVVLSERGDPAAVSGSPGAAGHDPLQRLTRTGTPVPAATPLLRGEENRPAALIGLRALERALSAVPGDPKGGNHEN